MAARHNRRRSDGYPRDRAVSRFRTSDGLRLAYHDPGPGSAGGPPVLCLPGLTRDMSDFDDMAAVIGGECRLIRMDYRGRGASDHDPDFMNYTLPVEAHDVCELLDHLGLDRVAIIGTSRGGLIAMLLAMVARDRLSGVVLNDVGPELDPAGLAMITTYLGRDPGFASHQEAADALPGLSAPGFGNVAPDQWLRAARRWWRDTPDGLKITYDPRLRDAVLAGMTGPPVDLWPLFDALDGMPLALLRGENSTLLARSTAHEMHRRRPDMIHAEIPDRAHVPFLDEPAAIAAIRALLARIK